MLDFDEIKKLKTHYLDVAEKYEYGEEVEDDEVYALTQIVKCSNRNTITTKTEDFFDGLLELAGTELKRELSKYLRG